jgi:hypothetical protein
MDLLVNYGIRASSAAVPYYEITIPSTYIDSTLTNFPMTVKLNSTNFDFNLSSDSSNIYFKDSTGTILNHEVEYYSTSESKAVYHVKIPTINSTVNTTFELYYDGTGYANGNNPTSVWDSNYSMVHHMGASLIDSTGNGHNGSNNGTTVVNGLNGQGRSFDGTNDNITFGTSIGNFGTSNFTIFTIHNSTQTNENIVLGKTNGGDASSTYGFLMATNGALAIASAGNWGVSGTYARYPNPRPSEVTGFKAHSIIGVRTQTNPTFGLNDNFYTSSTTWITGEQFNTVGNVSNSLQFTMGSESDGGFWFNGIIDEVRISNIARSTAWVKAEYEFLMNDRLTVVAK